MSTDYAIGTQFIKVGDKAKRVWSVIDILKTYNAAGELVKTRYVARTEIVGQAMTDRDVTKTTIARGLIG